MPARRTDRPFGSDNADFFGDYEDAWPPADSSGELSEAAQAAASVRFQPRDAQAVDNAVEEYRGRHRRQVPKSTMRARLRKAFKRG